MGVDWLTCKYCGENFPDCGSFVTCECGESWCCHECASEDGYEISDEDGKLSCGYCRGELVADSELLVSLMDYYELTLNDVYKVHNDLKVK